MNYLINQITCSIILSFTLIMVAGCGPSDVESRRLNTLESMEWSGGTADDQRKQSLIVAALKQADEKSLLTPTIVDVTVRIASDDPANGMMVIDWISASPTADEIRVILSDGNTHDVPIPDVYLEYSEQEAEKVVLYTVTIFAQETHAEIWSKVVNDPKVRVVLLANGSAVSNESGSTQLKIPNLVN